MGIISIHLANSVDDCMDLSPPRHIACEYQPLVCPRTLTIQGYEAQARFYNQKGKALAPNLVFDWLHRDSRALAAVELQAKLLQLNQAPKTPRLHLNLDPHALDSANCQCMMQALDKYQQQTGGLTVELIENTCVNDADKAQALLKELHRRGITVALDDVGAPHAMVSLQLLTAIDCIKLDRHWLSAIKAPLMAKLLENLLNFAKSCQKITILEGIETEQHLSQALALDVDLVQGFYFRPQFIQTEPELISVTI